MDSAEALTRPWRTGRHVGRTVYVMAGPEPSMADPLIGTMDTPELAAAACAAHNTELARGTAEPGAGQVTLTTIRQWAEQTMKTTAEAEPRSRPGGFRAAARDVLAILDMNGRPAHEPVIFSAPE